jgi:hypothetical protein
VCPGRQYSIFDATVKYDPGHNHIRSRSYVSYCSIPDLLGNGNTVCRYSSTVQYSYISWYLIVVILTGLRSEGSLGH